MTTLYHPREIITPLNAALADMPVVVLTGMRQVGKSTLLLQQPEFARRRYLTLDDFAQLEAARRAPEVFLQSEVSLTIDEAQKCPELLPAIKRAVDRDRRHGWFLLSGSANFALLHEIGESLAGRAVHLDLRPFTRREVEGTTGATPFLVRFFQQPQLSSPAEVRPVRAAEVLRGGMPPVCLGDVSDPRVWFRGYEQTYLERDVRALSQVADLTVFRNVLVLAALRTGQVLKISELARDAKLSAATVSRYLSVLETSFVIQHLPPYLNNRASRLIKSPKLYMGDAGLAGYLAGIHEDSFTPGDPHWGALLETYMAHNLAALLAAHFSDARLFFWNVQGRHEVDFVIEAGRSTMAIEIKSGTRWNDHDLAGLKAFLEATPHCKAAILAHNGTDAVPLGDRLWAIPLGMLLS